MKKVECITYHGGEFDHGTYKGITECCGATVSRSRCGCDEYCPKCGELLDWSDEEEGGVI